MPEELWQVAILFSEREKWCRPGRFPHCRINYNRLPIKNFSATPKCLIEPPSRQERPRNNTKSSSSRSKTWIRTAVVSIHRKSNIGFAQRTAGAPSLKLSEALLKPLNSSSKTITDSSRLPPLDHPVIWASGHRRDLNLSIGSMLAPSRAPTLASVELLVQGLCWLLRAHRQRRLVIARR